MNQAALRLFDRTMRASWVPERIEATFGALTTRAAA